MSLARAKKERGSLERLPAYALFGGILAAAGLPIYIYAPPFYAQTYGVSLTGIAAVLFWLRLLDAFQDPLFGWISERLGAWRAAAVFVAAVILALSMLGVFAVSPPIAPLVWFAVTITGLFSAFSFLSINFYAQGLQKAQTITGSHIRVATWRETGALVGVCIAAVLPTVLLVVTEAPEAMFAVIFAFATGVSIVAMRPEWRGDVAAQATPFRTILKDFIARRLLLLGFFNAIPVAVTSTLFLFYVGGVLQAEGWEGGLLVLFFLSGAAAAPIWSAVARRYGAKPVLLFAMASAILSFAFAVSLGPGDVALFALVCVASGATVGADLILLPALFSSRMAVINPNGGQGFGLWSLVAKFTLAFAAITMLPLLEMAGFQAGAEDNSQRALGLLSLLYGLVPCGFKVLAMVLLTLTPIEQQTDGPG